MAKAQPSLECRHIRINGTKCHAAALIDNAWCYYHDAIYREQRQKHATEAAARRSHTALAEVTKDYGCIPVTLQLQRDQPIEFPLLEDISSIQLAISRVLTALATNTIEPKRAGLLLYGLQVAAQNLPKSDLQRWNTVSDVARTREGFQSPSPNPPNHAAKASPPWQNAFASLSNNSTISRKTISTKTNSSRRRSDESQRRERSELRSTHPLSHLNRNVDAASGAPYTSRHSNHQARRQSMFQRSLLFALMIATASSYGHAEAAWRGHGPVLVPQQSGTTQLLIAVSPVNSRVVWAAGAGGTYTVTTDGGARWKSGIVPGAETLQFRDVQGVSDKVAYLMSIGDNTGDFRIYKTEDGGAHWAIQFQNKTVNAFYDCFAFWTPERGITHSDSVNGVFPDIRTDNGKTWRSIARNMPPALTGEASFSSSGTCIATQGWQDAWIATGGSSIARILATRDGGDTWNAYDTPLASNANAGGFSVAFRDSWHGIVGGGDLTTNDSAQAAVSENSGQTWTLTTKPPISGAIFGLAYANGVEQHDHWGDRDHFGEGHDRTVVITTETQPDFVSGAAAWSPDEGHTWFSLPQASGYWAVAFANPEAGWFVGNNGQILKISF